jgi:phosphoribosyl-ATP pyrophosphohydrolase/phosphoribosyl-AMP cyclohydrolase
MSIDLDAIDFTKGGGTVTVIAQDATSGAVLMVAHADREALEKTLATGHLHFRSRTRGLWKKGETSGNVLEVIDLAADCDRDAILARVKAAGPTCHLGTTTCWGEPGPITSPAAPGVPRSPGLADLARTIDQRKAEVDYRSSGGAPVESRGSYTIKLLRDRNLRLKKIGEEATELVIALAEGDKVRATEEAADLFYHALAALAAEGLTLADVERVIASRRK